MCRYCEEDRRKKRNFMVNTPTISLKIIKNNGFNVLEMKSYNHEKQVIKTYKIINYCPMCGRKLSKGSDYD